MAKEGQSSLAHVFYQIALSSLRCNPSLREYYEEKPRQGKPRKIAVVAIARKLVRIVYSMLKNGQLYTDSQRTKEKELTPSLTKEVTKSQNLCTPNSIFYAGFISPHSAISPQGV